MRRALPLSILFAACAVTDAPPLVVPGGMPDGATYKLEGIDGSRRGEVTVAGWTGGYERQFSTFDTNRWDQQRFDGSFRLSRAGGEAVGVCAMREGLLQLPAPFLQTVQVPAIAYAYDCEIEAEGRAGRLQIGEVVTSTFDPAGDRRGFAWLEDGPLIEVRSLHQLEGVSLRSQQPWGYVMSAEGRTLGVVDLRDARPVLTLAEDASEAAEITGLALAFLQTE